MTDAQAPAFPELHIHHFTSDSDGTDKPVVVPRWMGGLTKREYFASCAMQAARGSIAEAFTHFDDPKIVVPMLARISVMMADALIAELGK